MKRHSLPFFSVVFFIFILNTVLISQDIKKEKLPDGVQRWYLDTAISKPAFFEQLEKNFKIKLAGSDNFPFGRSIAFLVGVSEYKYLSPQLPFVSNDLELLGNSLLIQNGFDTVYVAEDDIVTTRLIEDYMVNKFRKSLSIDDRLLFYYSGHGADLGGKTGYLQFSEAQPDNFAFSVLAINRCEEWSTIIPAEHILFLYDCCASGLAYTAKSTPVDPLRVVETTMQKNGSRTVITAGTGDEETFGVDNQSVFTREFLNALNSPGQNGQVFRTIAQIFSSIDQEMREFSQRYDKKLTPRLWELQKDRYKGAFVFLAPQGSQPVLDANILDLLNASPAEIEKSSADHVLFRSEPVSDLSTDQLKSMLVQNGFFDEYENAVGSGFENKYIRNTDGNVIIDESSGLTWQQSGSDLQMTLDEAGNYLRELNRANFGGYDDWRLPTLEEALTLMEREKTNGDLHVHPYFDDVQVEIWTADQAGPMFAWAVSFDLGISGRNMVSNYKAWVRAVHQ